MRPNKNDRKLRWINEQTFGYWKTGTTIYSLVQK